MKRASQAGFSLLEIIGVATIGMVITAAAVPNMVTGIANMRLRSSMTSLAGVLQNCRVLAVKQNRHMTTHFNTQPYGILAYVKRSTDTTGIETHDSQVELEAPVTRVTTPSGPGAPSTISTTVLGFTPQTGEPSFNPTGLPCVYSSGSCANYGFVYYFHDSRPAGKMGWAALSISPAGRMKKWYWNGSNWAD
jgi:type II secretory pathway pseudopilin PulG